MFALYASENDQHFPLLHLSDLHIFSSGELPSADYHTVYQAIDSLTLTAAGSGRGPERALPPVRPSADTPLRREGPRVLQPVAVPVHDFAQ